MNKPFSAWKEGAPLYGLLLFIGVVSSVFGYWAVGVVFLAAGLFTLYFFRDPERTITADRLEAVSPADGTIVAVEELQETPHYDGPCRRISIFLSILDVHVNRAPAAGRILEIIYKPGRFLNAMKPETSECNASNTIFMKTDRGMMTVRQISGAIARRIICRVSKGESLGMGEKFGMIRFGSRTELYLPLEATVCVNVHDRVRAGTSIVARFKS